MTGFTVLSHQWIFVLMLMIVEVSELLSGVSQFRQWADYLSIKKTQSSPFGVEGNCKGRKADLTRSLFSSVAIKEINSPDLSMFLKLSAIGKRITNKAVFPTQSPLGGEMLQAKDRLQLSCREVKLTVPESVELPELL
jgi:hypothetical protein